MSSTLDDHIRAALDRVRVSLSGQLEADLTATTSDILRAVADEHRRALVQATEQTAAAIRSEAEQHLTAAREEFGREKEELARQKQELHRSSSNEISGLERVLGEVRDELDIARRNLDDLRNTREALERQTEEQRQEIERGRQQEEAIRRELRESNERARNESERTRLDLGSAARELEALRTRLAHSTRLASAFLALDEAKSLGDILEQLAHAACQESGRTAVFLVHGGKLRAWRALGFAEGEPIIGSDFDPAESDVIAEVVKSGTGQQHRNGDATRLPVFARAEGPRVAVALPVQVGGSIIAVLYSDAARTDTSEDPEWLNTIDAMTKHAGRVLEAMTVRQAAAIWTPRGGVVRS